MDLDDAALIDVLHELGHVAGGRLGEDLLRSADLNDLAVLHDADAIADAQRLVEVVGDEEDRLVEFGLNVHHLVLHLTTDQWIECREGLVHEQDGRIGGEGPGKADTLLHAARELAR